MIIGSNFLTLQRILTLMKFLSLINNIVKTLALFTMPVWLSGCFTGVEGTSRITISKKEASLLSPSEEDKYLSDLKAPVLNDWLSGKPFLITDEKINYVIDGIGNKMLVPGDTIFFQDIEAKQGPGGGETSVLTFSHKGILLAYPQEKPVSEIRQGLNSTQLPMLIDLELVNNFGRKLKGNTYWTKSALWYDDSLNYKKGVKFSAVTIEDVTPGNSFFPIKVKFKDTENRQGVYLLNAGTSGRESRNFSRLFYLTDPKNKYKNISDEIWSAICNEKLVLGMTKEECKLSRGNPSELDNGHNYNSAIEIWSYTDGTVLRFVDGLLVYYK